MIKLLLICIGLFIVACGDSEDATSAITDTGNETEKINEDESKEAIDELIAQNENLSAEDLKAIQEKLGNVEIVTSTNEIEGQYILVDEYKSKDEDMMEDNGDMEYMPTQEEMDAMFDMYITITGDELFVVVKFMDTLYLEENGTLSFNEANGDLTLTSKIDAEKDNDDEVTKILLQGDTLIVMNVDDDGLEIMKFIPDDSELPADLSALPEMPHFDDGGDYDDGTYDDDDKKDDYNPNDSMYYDDYMQDSTVSLIDPSWKDDDLVITLPDGVFELTDMYEERTEYNEDGSQKETEMYDDEDKKENGYLVFDATAKTITFVISMYDEDKQMDVLYKEPASKMSSDGSILIVENEHETSFIHIKEATAEMYEFEQYRERYRMSDTGNWYLAEKIEEKGKLSKSTMTIDLNTIEEIPEDFYY